MLFRTQTTVSLHIKQNKEEAKQGNMMTVEPNPVDVLSCCQVKKTHLLGTHVKTLPTYSQE